MTIQITQNFSRKDETTVPSPNDRKKTEGAEEEGEGTTGTTDFLGWLLIMSLARRPSRTRLPACDDRVIARRMRKINKMNQQPAPWGASRVASGKN